LHQQFESTKTRQAQLVPKGKPDPAQSRLIVDCDDGVALEE
jgi:hypothetical protein